MSHPHRRQNLLTGDWVLVSPHRLQRPWQGDAAPPAAPARAHHDASCHLCPGNPRSGGQTNPDYRGVHIFPNDFPALLAQTTAPTPHPLFQEAPARGEAHVICYSPDHAATLARLDDAARQDVIDGWCKLSADLGARWGHVQIFENQGAMMGASSPHPHGQVWASDFIPTHVAREDVRQRAHLTAHQTPLLAAVAQAEIEAATRVITANDHWLAIVPHWAAWPYESLIIARAPIQRLEQLSPPQRAALAQLLGRLLGAANRLFDTDCPYSLGWHGAPHALGEDTAHWRLHAHIFPPLLRSASIRKHMVGFELLAETQRDLTPEDAAARLRAMLP